MLFLKVMGFNWTSRGMSVYLDLIETYQISNQGLVLLSEPAISDSPILW